MTVEVRANVDKDLQDRARLIYVPLGYNSSYAAIAAVEGGLEERFSEDEYELIKEADDNIWGAKLVPTNATPITAVQKYYGDFGKSYMTRSVMTIKNAIEQAKTVYTEIGFASLAEAYRNNEGSDVALTRQQRSNIIDGYYALTDRIDLSAIKAKQIEDTYRQAAREITKKMEFNSVGEAYRAIEKIEPFLTAKEIAQFKTGWQLINEGREEKKNRKSSDTAKVYSGGTTSTNRYPSRVVSTYQKTGTMPRTNYNFYGDDDDYSSGYGWQYGGGRGTWEKYKDVEEWQTVTASYVAARNEGKTDVYIGTQDVPENPIVVAIVEGDAPIAYVQNKNNMEAADDGLSDAALAIGEVEESLKKILEALGLKNPGNILTDQPLSMVVNEMIGDGTKNKARESVANAIVLANRELAGLKYHFQRIEEYVAQESSLDDRLSLTDEMKLRDSVDTSGVLVYPTEDDDSGDYTPRINEPVDEFLERISGDERNEDRFDG